MHTLLNIFYGLLMTLLVAMGGLFLVTLTPLNTGVETKIVRSGSMAPAIPLGALVVIKPSADYHVDDIITFGEDSQSSVPTTHRIVSIGTNGGAEWYTTKGDANKGADPQPVARSSVIGKVLLSIPFAGYVLNFARQPLGFVLLIALPAVLIIIDELVIIVKEITKLRRKKTVPRSYSLRTRRIGDEIFLPASTRIQSSRTLARGAYASVLWILLIASVSLGIISGNLPSTVSYFSDTEQSVGNTFEAGTWTND